MKYPIEIKSLDHQKNDESVLRILTGTGSRIGDLFVETISRNNGSVYHRGTQICIDSGLYKSPDPFYSKVKEVWTAAFEKTQKEIFQEPGKLPVELFQFNKEDVVTFWPSQEIPALEHVRLDFIKSAYGFVGLRTGYTNEDIMNGAGVVWLAGPDNDNIAQAVGPKRYQSRNKIFGDLYESAANGKIANVLNPFKTVGVR